MAVGPGLDPPAGGGEERRTRGSETLSSIHLHHGWAREGEEMEGMGSGG